MDVLEQRLVTDVSRRASLLPADIESWVQKAENNANGLGIHRSQFRALRDQVLDELLKEQTRLTALLTPNLPAPDFAKAYGELSSLVVGALGVWRVFRYIMSQLEDAHLAPMIDAADLVAASCYLDCMKRARNLGVVTDNDFREPPLVYLDADASPATANRTVRVAALGFQLDQFNTLRLPIPVIIMPFDYVTCLWLFTTLHHEVGHNLDQDLNLDEELRKLLVAIPDTDVPPARLDKWLLWRSEMLADAFGVLLGGEGYAWTMLQLLLPTAPLAPDINSQDAHPHAYVRVPLICAMLRLCGVQAWSDAADAIEAVWAEYKPLIPPTTLPYIDEDLPKIAPLFVTRPLAALKQNPIRALVPNLAGDAKLTGDLARFLRTGKGLDQPEPFAFPYRLVPPAAQLALAGAGANPPPTPDSIQANALKHMKDINRPQFLKGNSNKELLRQLARELARTLEVTP